MANYTFVMSDPDCFTVGFIDDADQWQAESDWFTLDQADQRARELNRAQAASEPAHDN